MCFAMTVFPDPLAPHMRRGLATAWSQQEPAADGRRRTGIHLLYLCERGQLLKVANALL